MTRSRRTARPRVANFFEKSDSPQPKHDASEILQIGPPELLGTVHVAIHCKHCFTVSVVGPGDPVQIGPKVYCCQPVSRVFDRFIRHVFTQMKVLPCIDYIPSTSSWIFTSTHGWPHKWGIHTTTSSSVYFMQIQASVTTRRTQHNSYNIRCQECTIELGGHRKRYNRCFINLVLAPLVSSTYYSLFSAFSSHLPSAIVSQ